MSTSTRSAPGTAGMDLPRLTRDPAIARADLDRAGYCLLADAIDPGRLAALRERLDAQAAGERALGIGYMDGGGSNQRLWMLVNKGKVFRDLVLDPVVEPFLGHLLGADFLLSSLTANIAGPGGEAMVLHQDQYYSRVRELPVVANVAYMLDDFTAENGATVVAPGSHRDLSLSYSNMPTNLVSACAPAGSALVFDGRLWHGTGQNRTADQHRRALLMYCCRPFMRQQENLTLGLARDLARTERPAFLRRMGFYIWEGLGRISETAPRTHKGPIPWEERPVGPLNPDGTPRPE
ncbi:MAG: phytanoyl-CoA dioxygenase family protein [Alphaproteobacteria bacterium]|nr:phytanoyl-CoA dioxygenase family protein [Alphaproteobacteria bacterium]